MYSVAGRSSCTVQLVPVPTYSSLTNPTALVEKSRKTVMRSLHPARQDQHAMRTHKGAAALACTTTRQARNNGHNMYQSYCASLWQEC